MKRRPTRCHGGSSLGARHARGCRKGRPLCRWMRATNERRARCDCPAYHFPHRNGGGACGDPAKYEARLSVLRIAR